MRYASKRQYVWSDNIAYAVGLMASDGCLSRDGRHLDLTSIDIEQLTNFMAAIGRDLVISQKTNGRGGVAYRVQFSDVAFYDFLLSAGLTPNKSLTLVEVTVPDVFYADFLRGLFDGDGTCYGSFDPRWPNSFQYYLAFCAANKLFLDAIQTTNQRLFGTRIKTTNWSTRVHSLTYGKQDSIILHQHMYLNSSAKLFLTRKQVKLEGFISRDSMVK